jgi:long-chain acyl-CoA synthetase
VRRRFGLARDLRFFDIIGLPVGQGYGLTESGGLCFVQRPDRPNVAGSCGTACEGTEWKIGRRRRDLRALARRVQGLPVRRRRHARVTAADGWLATGDIVETRGDGE